jgi:HCOMODA/2-hydroxy-3-carboxy-muconic semialdehyde decarboxylase
MIGRRSFLAVLAAGSASAVRAASPAPTPQAEAEAPSPALIDLLVAGNRILADQGVVDGFGHLSARHDRRPDRFLIARSMAPGLVTAADIMETGLDGVPVDPRGRTPYLERFIHSEIYRARPDVMAVVHSHSPAVIPFGVTRVPLRPVYHMASFLGAGAPVFEIREVAGPDNDMLIRTPELGRALAKALGGAQVALMRGHGYVATGNSVKTAVMHAVYTEIGARVQAEAMKLGEVTYLNPSEAARISPQNDALVDKNWDLWRARAMGK